MKLTVHQEFLRAVDRNTHQPCLAVLLTLELPHTPVIPVEHLGIYILCIRRIPDVTHRHTEDHVAVCSDDFFVTHK